MRFQCTFCSYVMLVEDSHRGYKVNCPSCGKSVLVPVGRFDEGCVIGDFVIKAKIGEGSIGAVYRAQQISLDRIVALKILSPEYTNTKGLNDFLREARAAAKLSHTNIVQALAVGEEDGTCYMAMTYINGETVKARLKREGKIPVDEALHIVQQVAEALYYAWDEAGMIHRDVKPDNIMITEDGIVKLTDLGLAIQQAEWREDMEISGSPSYMSPEQFTGEKLDSRSDIYSLGVTLYQMISGALPFDGQTVKTVARQHFEEEPTPLNKRDPAIPGKVAQFVKKMMSKSPDDRFPNLEDLLRGIWTIRHKTAPDTSLIPDVHTISIKRLDYDIQHELVEKKNAKRKADKASKPHWDLFRIAVVATPVILIFIVLLVIVLGHKSANEEGMTEKVAYFARLISDKTIDPNELMKEGAQILSDFGSPKTPRQEFLHAQIKYYMADVGRRKAENDVKILKAALKDAQTSATNLKTAVEGLKTRVEQTGKKSSSVEEDRNSAKAELQAAREELAKAKDELAQAKASSKSLADYVKKLHAENERAWMDDFRLRYFSAVSQAKLKEAEALVAVEAAKRGDVYKDWFSARSLELERLSKILLDLSDSGTKFAGSVIDGDCKVVMISDGVVDYQDSSNRIKQKPWNELSPEGATALASKDNKITGSENDIKAAILLMRGEIGAATKLLPADKGLAATAKVVLARGLESVKCLALFDKRRAEAKAQTLVRQLEGFEELTPAVKADLKPFLSGAPASARKDNKED